MIRIRAFKAISEPESCIKFAEGHLQVLKEFDIAMITPMNLDWMNDPYTYLVVAESVETGKTLGGAQIQAGGGKRNLPIIAAIKEIDDRITDVVKTYGLAESGEIHSIWNSKEIAGLGIGNYYLTMAAVAMAPALNIKTLFALSSPYTTGFYTKFGFEVTTFLGNNGSFFYPKKDLTAVSMALIDCATLSHAEEQEKNIITSLRNSPAQAMQLEGKKGGYEILFSLDVKSPAQHSRY